MALVALLALSSGLSFGLPSQAATSERVVTDRYSGLAIGGFDPVAYFTDGEALAGSSDFELTLQGTVWRFRSEGNRAAFEAYPEIYGPQFGGYDPVDMARGVVYPGSPRLWLVVGRRLYLFGRPDSRDAFAAAPGRFLTAADRNWPAAQAALSR